jgi:hypothetical protein
VAKVCKSLVVDGDVDAQLLGMLCLGLGVEAGDGTSGRVGFKGGVSASCQVLVC